MSDAKRRPVSSWPAALLPTLALLALLTGGAATASSSTSSDSTPVVEMTVADAP